MERRFHYFESLQVLADFSAILHRIELSFFSNVPEKIHYYVGQMRTARDTRSPSISSELNRSRGARSSKMVPSYSFDRDGEHSLERQGNSGSNSPTVIDSLPIMKKDTITHRRSQSESPAPRVMIRCSPTFFQIMSRPSGSSP